MGRVSVDAAPIVQPGVPATLATTADPLPQALVLTAIVISFAMTAVLLVHRAARPRPERQRPCRRPGGAALMTARCWAGHGRGPVVLPLLPAALLLLLEKAGARWVAPLSTAAGAGARRRAAGVARPRPGGVQVYLLGNWRRPSASPGAGPAVALMLVLTALVAWPRCCTPGAVSTARAHFHALFQFQLMGLYGAFLTADLFNLFVFFEVLLAASYGLLLHGARRARVRPAALRGLQPGRARRCS
jgi:hypothetical protein